MCAITGVFHFNNSSRVRECDLVKMRDTMIHRGPDDGGIYLSRDERVGLGSRRLSIIDLSSAGHMPMTTMRGGSWIVFNGEVYNFAELRAELQKKGHRFHSHTDTEVILASYQEYGHDCVRRFNGMFAFAIWDETTQTLFAARDHIGIKPFYYAVHNGTFYFASEPKAILAHPDFPKELDEQAVSHYLTFSSSPAPHTLFQGIRKLPPAHFLTLSCNGMLTLQEYWTPVVSHYRNQSEDFYIEEIRRLLRASIKAQMVSDVPFGCFLSGGIDSSTNAALMSEALGKPVETFSVGSKQFEKYNEFYYSRLIAQQLGARTHEILIDDSHMEEFLARFPFFADDLNGDQVCLPLFWLSKFTRDNGVTVIQIGEGSDELFAGYRTYTLATSLYYGWWRWLEKLPPLFLRGVFSASHMFSHPRFEFHKEYLRRLAYHQEPFWGSAIAFSDYQKDHLLAPSFRSRIRFEESYETIEAFYTTLRGLDSQADFLTHLTYLEIKHRLPELLLMRADRMTMAHSLEARVPFLDHRLVELALQIPSSLKLKQGTEKYILKKAVEGIIPPELIWRKKQGFATSMSEWLRPSSPLSSLLLDRIRHSKLRARGILNYDYVERLIRAHQHQGVEHNFRIWNLVTLSLWYDYWFG